MPRIIIFCILAALSVRANSLYNVTIDTSGLSGDNGLLVFDFISGGGPANAVSISDFTTDGTFGAATTTGTVVLIPNPPYPIGTVLLIDDPVNSVFNEYNSAFTFGTTMSFVVDASENAPGSGNSPDELSLFFLEPDDMTSLITTDDPTFADSLLTLDLDGSANGVPTVFDVSDPSGVSASMTLPGSGTVVPEPSFAPSLAVVLICLLIFRSCAGLRQRKRGKRGTDGHFSDFRLS